MCRAFLSPWFERGGMQPADGDDKPVYVGRFNVGAVSLNLPMILAKSRSENKGFHEVLDYYLEMIRNIHKRTYEYVGELRASTNPIQFCEGGILGGHLNPSDKVKSLLKPMTASFGITALNELQRLYNGKSITEDGEFALDTLQYINDKVNQFKHEDGWLYAIYGTPAENLCLHGDTKVQTNKGCKPIRDIKAGDLVYSYNETKHTVELKPVISSRLTQTSASTMKITFKNGYEVICTPNHPFGKSNGKIGNDEKIEYVEARDLKAGDFIRSNSMMLDRNGILLNGVNDRSTVVNLEIVDVKELEELYDVYNLEVSGNHNFFIGEMNDVNVSNGVLVHNCSLQVEQFRRLYGVIENVSDKPYVSNSFHCHVSEDITPIQKQNLEGRFWNLCNGGKIQYCRYPLSYNKTAVKTLVDRAMKMGYYEGVNLSLAYCDDCGYQELEMDICPRCGSRNLTKVDRMNGYLAYSRVHGDSRLNDGKMAEIADRKSM